MKKFLWWSLAVLGMTIAVLLLYLVVTKDLGTADQLASVVGAIVGLAALGVSVYALMRSEPDGVHASDGSNAARGAIRNASAIDTAQNPSPPPANGGISATSGSNAAGGDIDGSTARKGQ
ncbi:hypothetical protein [Streptomyces microflavus]|uniref:hypothetical protein n=1 Tax=Streptomyces microflavus TaxID=1919 RepID=UPI00380EE30F